MPPRRSSTPSRLLVAFAALSVAAIAPIGPGGHAAMQALAAATFADGTAGAFTLPAFGLRLADDPFVGAVGLALLAFLPRLVLAIATTQRARGRRVEPLRAIHRSLGRMIRTRGVSLMVATFTFGAVAYLLLRVGTQLASAPAALALHVLATLLVSAGLGMASLADRAAVLDVDGSRDARAAALRREARTGGPHYLDTATARRGYDVATSADDATTIAMRAFLGPWAWGAAATTWIAEALPVVFLVVASRSLEGSSAQATALFAAHLLLRAVLEVGVAWVWSRAYVHAIAGGVSANPRPISPSPQRSAVRSPTARAARARRA